MENRIHKAHKFAKEKHKDQKRKFTGKPYLTHLENTANLLWMANKDAKNEDFVAALLHDVVEDTSTTFKEVDQNFGREVMNLVAELTNNKNYVEGKEVYLTKKINKMSKRAFTIKLCDRLDNITGLDGINVPSDFKTRYIDETKYIITNLDRKINGIQKYLLHKIKSTLLYLELNSK